MRWNFINFIKMHFDSLKAKAIQDQSIREFSSIDVYPKEDLFFVPFAVESLGPFVRKIETVPQHSTYKNRRPTKKRRLCYGNIVQKIKDWRRFVCYNCKIANNVN